MKILSICFCLLTGMFATAQKAVKLFDGKDLAGWTVHGTEKWYAKDGLLI